jgi:GT2 family glycosyltransferase
VTLADLDVVFLVWRESPAMLARHHAAVAAALPPAWPGTALLFQNGAAERTAAGAEELVRASYPHATRIALRSQRNRGFARAMNLALAECPGRYVALVNSDGRPEPRMFERLIAVLDEHPTAIWAAPAIHGPGEPNHPPGPPIPRTSCPGWRS